MTTRTEESTMNTTIAKRAVGGLQIRLHTGIQGARYQVVQTPVLASTTPESTHLTLEQAIERRAQLLGLRRRPVQGVKVGAGWEAA
jgi:hypothetical protein